MATAPLRFITTWALRVHDGLIPVELQEAVILRLMVAPVRKYGWRTADVEGPHGNCVPGSADGPGRQSLPRLAHFHHTPVPGAPVAAKQLRAATRKSTRSGFHTLRCRLPGWPPPGPR